MSEVTFTIFHAEDPWPLISTPETNLTVYGEYAEHEGYGADCASAVTAQYFEEFPELWNDWFGDCDSETVMIEIIRPEASKGIYKVEVERKFTGSAMLTNDPRS